MLVEQPISASCKANSIDHSETNKNYLQCVEKRQEVSVHYLKLVLDHTQRYSEHNARNKIRVNWTFMQNLKVWEMETSVSRLYGSVSWLPVFVDSDTETGG
jgi:hypothetical protein